MKEKNNGWIVIVGQPIFTCRTRKQARGFAKRNKHKLDPKQYHYVGKCTKNYEQIVLDV